MGNHVVCLDVDARKIQVLNEGGVPIFERGLKEIVQRNAAAGRLQFTTDIRAAVGHGTMQFTDVGTPPDEDAMAPAHFAETLSRYQAEFAYLHLQRGSRWTGVRAMLAAWWRRPRHLRRLAVAAAAALGWRPGPG